LLIKFRSILFFKIY